MKVAIMTQPLGSNYGGIMQAWALQQVLKNMGHEPLTVNRVPDNKGMVYNVARNTYYALMRILRQKKRLVDLEVHAPVLLRNTYGFIESNINISSRIDTTLSLKHYFKNIKFDAVIVGSDQTWRPIYSPNIDNYFLDFLVDENIIRIAYASSFGVNSWEFDARQTRKFAYLVSLFHGVGVRERSGISLCKKYLAVKAVHVLDPTLLLSAGKYRSLIGDDKILDEAKGVYTYFLDQTETKYSIARKIAEKSGDFIYSAQAKCGLDVFDGHVGEDFIMPDVEDWLAGFANARFVVTDSFHGMVFAIIFKKPFRVIVNEKRGLARFQSLSEALGLSSNNFVGSDALEIPPIDDGEDYESIFQKLEEHKNVSLLFLERALTGATS